MKTIVLQGHDRKGWHTETCHNMEEVKDYLLHPHHGIIHAYIDGCWEKHFLVPAGLGVRFELDALDRMYY